MGFSLPTNFSSRVEKILTRVRGSGGEGDQNPILSKISCGVSKCTEGEVEILNVVSKCVFLSPLNLVSPNFFEKIATTVRGRGESKFSSEQNLEWGVKM